MNDHNFHRRESSRKTARLWPQFLIGAIGIGMVVAWVPAQASESQTLWECSSYTGDAHTRCLEGFAESQRDQIAALLVTTDIRLPRNYPWKQGASWSILFIWSVSFVRLNRTDWTDWTDQVNPPTLRTCRSLVRIRLYLCLSCLHGSRIRHSLFAPLGGDRTGCR